MLYAGKKIGYHEKGRIGNDYNAKRYAKIHVGNTMMWTYLKQGNSG